MPQVDPNGRQAALQVASQGQPAGPGENYPEEPNVQPEMPPQLEQEAAQKGLQDSVGAVLARLNVLEQTLVAKGVVMPDDLNPMTPPGGAQDPSLQLPGLQSGVGGPPTAPGAGGPPPGAPPQAMGGGPKQPM